MRFVVATLMAAALPTVTLAADTPRAGWYTVRTQMSADGQRWQDMPRAVPNGGFCVLGLGEPELEQIYRQAFERDNCQVQSLRIASGSGSGSVTCQANGYPARLQITGRYSKDRFDTNADSQGGLVVEPGKPLPVRILSRTEAQRERDCSAEERRASEREVSAPKR